MIYTMPFNADISNLIPPQPTVSEMANIKRRIAAGLGNLGYDITDIVLGPNGEFMIEANADPSGDWESLIPPDKTPEQLLAHQERLFIEDALSQLKTKTLAPANIQRVIGWLVEQELARTDGA